MAQHDDQAALDPLPVEGEQADGDEGHVRDRGISDQLLHVLLHERDQRGVDHRDHREREDDPDELRRGLGEHRQREADEAVAAHLQEHAGEDHRARGRRLDVGVGKPGMDRPHRHLHREAGEEGEPEPGLRLGREIGRHQVRDEGRVGVIHHPQHRDQHQHRAEQGVEEEFIGRVDAVLAAPDADDQVHRDQAGLEEDVEEDRGPARRTRRASASPSAGNWP